LGEGASRQVRETQGLSSDDERASVSLNMIYRALEKSTIVPRIFREVYGDVAPPDGVCPMSFITKMDLERASKELMLKQGSTFLDLACGGGGPGLWVARKTGTNLVGIDISTVALEQAARRAEEFGLASRAEYKRGSFTYTGMGDESFDGVLCFDALWIASDKPSVLREIRRIMRPATYFVFTSWEDRVQSGDKKSYRTMLQEAGFRVRTYEETPNWENLNREVYNRWIASRDELIREIGENVTAELIREAESLTSKQADGTDRLSHIQRVFVSAQRP